MELNPRESFKLVLVLKAWFGDKAISNQVSYDLRSYERNLSNCV